MLVSEIIDKIQSKEIKIKELALELGVSDRTIQNKIRQIGYVWIPKESRYEYTGADPEPLELDFKSLFDKKDPKASKSSQKQSTSLSKASTNKSNSNSKSSPLDMIDVLLASDSNSDSKRKYRGFYLDSDILEILDRINKGNKSDLVNEALRKVFREKGLL